MVYTDTIKKAPLDKALFVLRASAGIFLPAGGRAPRLGRSHLRPMEMLRREQARKKPPFRAAVGQLMQKRRQVVVLV